MKTKGPGDFYTSHTWTNDKIPEPAPTSIATFAPSSRPQIPAPNTGENNSYMLFAITTSLAIMGIISAIIIMRKEE